MDVSPAHEALDELGGRPCWDGAHGFHLRPLGEFVDGNIELAVVGKQNHPSMSNPQTAKGHVSGIVWSPYAGW